ncbi:hypothetical protein [Aquisalimonas sp.]|uniref:hypothetical protein n=1 Tax=Aquisalimonas sp. TaxID=1872621 RepID=UPI0025C39100|nr:hypothetical protein [Aquisalimonas sp.]
MPPKAPVWGDLPRLWRAVRNRDEARRLARASARLIMLLAVAVVAMGVLTGETATMVEGTLVALLALAAGWLYSRSAAVALALLLFLGLLAGLLGGQAPAGLLLQGVVLLICLRLAQATIIQHRGAG